MTEQGTKKTVVVTGDVNRDLNIVQDPNAPSRYSDEPASTIMSVRLGGAWYLRDLVDLACRDKAAPAVGPQEEAIVCTGADLTISQAYQIWSLFEREKGASDKLWRIRSYLGCQRPAPGSAYVPKLSPDPTDPDVLVIDDLNLGFRELAKEHWPAAIKHGNAPGSIVVKVSSLPDDGTLWSRLSEPRYADVLTIVIGADVLRDHGAAISRSLSWDKAIEDIKIEFESGLCRRYLSRFRRAIVHFGCGGAASFSRCSWKTGQVEHEHAVFERFLYHPDEQEDSFKARRPGSIFGTGSLLAAAVTRHEVGPQSYPLFIALSRGLAAARLNYDLGGGCGKFDSDHIHEDVGRVFRGEAPAGCKGDPSDVFFAAFPRDVLGAVADAPRIESDTGAEPTATSPRTAAGTTTAWCGRERSSLLRDLVGDTLDYTAAKAVEVVLSGLDKALGPVPKARYGRFLTVDREEIERINAIRNLIGSYQDNRSDIKPLSIAVFGPPGSGKSFAIKEMASELFPGGKAVEEFNLSHFQNEADLHQAFHMVRDASVRGQVPLVFWDEFDTNSIEWIRHFLAPMQDAVFQVGGIKHPFGKCIFVFAGGTCHTFECFDRTNRPGNSDFIAKKGPDFVSRLRGYINIKGPNPSLLDQGTDPATAEQDETDEGYRERQRLDPDYLIRRAVIFRLELERHYKHLLTGEEGGEAIGPEVINAFLWVKKFNHGARSISALVSMSQLVGARHFGQSALPTAELVATHASRDFYERLDEARSRVFAMPPSHIERLARACHQGWRALKEKQGWSYGKKRDNVKKKHELLVDYAQLDEEGKERNRGTARVHVAKLKQAGYQIEFRPDDGVPKPALEVDTARLAVLEHEVWLREHLHRGFQWAPETDEAIRLHRDALPYDEVPPEDRQLDEAIVSAMMNALRELGYRVVANSPPGSGAPPGAASPKRRQLP